RPVNRAERTWRWCKRNPVVAGLLTAVATLLLGGAGVSTAFAVQAGRKAEDERQARADAEHETERAEDEKGRAQRGETEAKEQKDRAEELLYLSQIALAHRAWEGGQAAQAREFLRGTREDSRNWEYRYL